MKDALLPHFQELNLKIRPAFFTLTWTSINIGDFIKESKTELCRL